MKFTDYQEKVQHGSLKFPFAYYYVSKEHKRYVMNTHWHKECEIIRVLDGSFLINSNGKTHNATKGSIYFVNSGSIHSGIPTDCVYECIVFDMASLLQRNPLANKAINDLIDYRKEILNIYEDKEDEAYKTLLQLFSLVKEKKQGYELQTYGTFYIFLGLVEQFNLYRDKALKASNNRKLISKVKEVFFFIEQHYSEDISIDDMAKAINMSDKYFCRFFKEVTQKTPNEYLNWFRIECACNKIKSSNESLASIAYGCGFNDSSYFVKVFKKYINMTPKEYAKLYANS